MTFYRKYRPRTIADLDLESVATEGLGKLLQGQSLAHAYLFTGPRGSGKTSAARILAKLVNCEKNRETLEKGGKLNEPCLECASCQSIEAGSNLDVIEIDAASNRGIDAIRELRDKIGLSPVSGLKKVYIIDEVHMLTAEAFNALLKTLEEPPAHAAFILCTTESHKVPETIVSRCRLVGFVKASPAEVKKSLSKAITGEKLEIDAEALDRLASAVDGSFREGHKLLEQLSEIGKSIALTDVETLLGLGFVHRPAELAVAMAKKDTKTALEMVAALDKKGVNWHNFVLEMLRFYQRELEANFGLGEKISNLTVAQLRQATVVVNQAAVEMRTSLVPSLPLELAAIGMENSAPALQPPIRTNQTPPEIKKNFSQAAAPEITATLQKNKPQERQTDKAVDELPDDLHLELTTVLEKWPQVIHACEPKNHSVAGLLRSSRPKELDGRDLVLEVFYKFHKEQLELDGKMSLLEEALEQIVGPLRVRCVLGEKAVRTLSVATESSVEAPEMDAKELAEVEEVFGLVH